MLEMHFNDDDDWDDNDDDDDDDDDENDEACNGFFARHEWGFRGKIVCFENNGRQRNSNSRQCSYIWFPFLFHRSNLLYILSGK